MEAALTVLGDDELVTANTSSILVEPYIRRITETVTTVPDIPGFHQYILYVQPLLVVFVCEIGHSSTVIYRPNPTPCSAALMPASKARLAISCGESTPGFI